MNYKDWLDYKSRIEGRDVSQDEQDYDLEGFYNTLKATPIEGGHLPDTFKKPNHPTFSDQSKYHVPFVQQGGSWSEEGVFTPSEHNLKNMGKSNLQSYFNEVESPEALNLPQSARMSALRKLSER
jgi:hypothetical protein